VDSTAIIETAQSVIFSAPQNLEHHAKESTAIEDSTAIVDVQAPICVSCWQNKTCNML
jgi:hypothetical protein